MKFSVTWLLAARLTLPNGDEVLDDLISLHLSKRACMVAIPAAKKKRTPGRRYDCYHIASGWTLITEEMRKQNIEKLNKLIEENK